MRIEPCKEVIAPMPFPAQNAAVRAAAEDAGVAVTGLHWLLVKPAGLSITARGAAIRKRSVGALLRDGYPGDVAVEPFDHVPDGPGAAARAVGYIRGILEALGQP